jgi:hypothetical protein
MAKNDIYDIFSYTEEELYEILDLVNPSDRELEAKILMMIHKYENTNTKSGKRLSEFFENVYDRFFQDNETEYTSSSIDSDDKETIQVEGFENITAEEAVVSTNAAQESADKDVPAKDDKVVYTTELAYSKGALNPILKQTTKRIISIDSQYRPDKRTLSTEFTFNLSEPLKDVVSLKLYSVQIPYTWYTIGKSYGSNFFIFSGKTPGIDNENHDIQIEIDAGNYRPQELIDQVNESIQTKSDTIDANIADSALVYNTYTSLTKFNVDIKKQFNESSYYLSFPFWQSPYQPSEDRNKTIPSYLGFNTNTYYLNILHSPNYYSLEDTELSTDSNATFTINSTNNFLNVIQYSGSFPYSSSSVVDLSARIQFSLVDGTYTRTELISDLNSQIQGTTSLYDSSIVRQNIDTNNNEFVSLTSNIQLKMKFARDNVNSNKENKTIVIFPDSSDIWVGGTSCFRFDASYNELNEIYSEVSPILQTDNYVVEQTPHIDIKCIEPGFINNINDISLNIANSTGDGYSLTQFIDVVNDSIRTYDTSYQITYGHSLLNSPASNYSFDSSTETYPSGTLAYINEDKFHLYLDINRTFDETMYEMDLTGSIFKTNILLKNTDGTDLSSDILTDLTQTYTANVNAGGVNVLQGTIICTINPKTGTINGNEGDTSYVIVFDQDYSFNSYPEFEAQINIILTNYIDPISGLNIFAGTALTSSFINGSYVINFNINITKKLVAKSFSVQIIDTVNDNWKKNLFIDLLQTDVAYSMNIEIPTIGSTLVYNADNEVIGEMTSNRAFLIIARATILLDNTLTIETGINDTFSFIGFEEGVYSANGENNIVITLASGVYSSTDLIEEINRQINTSISEPSYVDSFITIVSDDKENVASFSNTLFSIVERSDGNKYVKMNANIIRTYDAQDYNLVFYDRVSFSKCITGASSVQNTTWDTTVGWIMGFREFTSYDLSATYDATLLNTVVYGDTGVSTNLFNYFLLCLDDFNQNRLNDGLVTITGTDTGVPLPSYAKRSEFLCDPVSGELVYNNTAGLTEKQIYAANEIANSGSNTDSIGSSVSTKSYGTGPYATDVFGLIPIKTSGLATGASFVEFGGTLQNQERSYFGPVNIQRMSVRLLSDRGNNVDLNNANWSFSLICEQLNKLEPKKEND